MKVSSMLVCLLLLTDCTPKRGETSLDIAAYELEINTWHEKRVTALAGPQGWLNVAGLYWLKEGINTFGADTKNDVVFPEGKIAGRAGYFVLKQGIVTVDMTPGVVVKSSGQEVSHVIMFHPDSASNPTLENGPLRWFIIKRDSKYGVRLRDLECAELKKFSGIDRYTIDPLWKVTARVVKTEGRTIPITNVLGQTTEQASPGTLVFTIQGKEFKLDALDEGGDDLFIIFGDATNTRETYGAGRYLYVKRPDSLGMTEIDFNKSYNPPCAFTAFATCPLPPKQNRLPIDVQAGEKNYESH